MKQITQIFLEGESLTLTINMNLLKQNINQMLNKIQTILMMKASISNNRILQLNKVITEARMPCELRLVANYAVPNLTMRHQYMPGLLLFT